jgi:hypothetical protein
MNNNNNNTVTVHNVDCVCTDSPKLQIMSIRPSILSSLHTLVHRAHITKLHYNAVITNVTSQ